MTMEQAAMFFSGSILVMLGIVSIVIGIVAINNIFHKYWHPVKWNRYEYHPLYFDAVDGAPLTPKPQSANSSK